MLYTQIKVKELFDNRQVGKIKISVEHFLYNLTLGTAAKLFGNVIITRVEYIMHEELFEYTCYSPYFEKINEGDNVPYYNVAVDTYGSIGGCAVYFNRLKDGN